jgi:hypothetical protein
MSHRGTLKYEAVQVDMQMVLVWRHPHSKHYLAQSMCEEHIAFADPALNHPDADNQPRARLVVPWTEP